MSDLRATSRLRTFLRARADFDDGCTTLDCTIRDQSNEGARLEFGTAMAVPDQFNLIIPSKNTKARVEVRWRRGNSVGVSFLRSAVPKQEPSSDVAERLARLEGEVAELRTLVAALIGNRAA